MSTPAQRLVLFAGTGAGVGYTIYFASNKKEVETLTKESKKIEELVKVENKKLSSFAKDVEEYQVKEQALVAAAAAQSKALSDIQSKLEEARKSIAKLEKEVADKVAAKKKADDDLISTRSKLADLVAQTHRSRENVSLSEKSLELAKQKVDNARLLLNPLNHPRVQKFFNK
uniref:MICOS complex subunit MIC60 n=1 Tax=Polytomella parva TaxID=51329 RepID=A0A7S0URZ6_9CHLO|mmetsp:Transcript_19495/g.35168  ORF Transcript_19495/g.35168 Transcript_19495/m.35168 type:complete len:172 (+) Transcript_19495:53-568(+)|eukprot:CAMPEP_0175067750 /NCGR_PEP_ID=MMETSP0052_2-20121109/17278_1 /TAXON_ID=51329 ORGANISM="Polytomella parva, Strain SAG 63-3" /NCGR_SAMPLE_ID=MMETSP0052_2 /ASSEMBLY_ACC=CAM_ASM_000194 /LENGTH=171 /DNA_ID=CAMNT_0016334679 /DNA_START=33 /DNA_END=548 /DNA_ORIENTATION=+